MCILLILKIQICLIVLEPNNIKKKNIQEHYFTKVKLKIMSKSQTGFSFAI